MLIFWISTWILSADLTHFPSFTNQKSPPQYIVSIGAGTVFILGDCSYLTGTIRGVIICALVRLSTGTLNCFDDRVISGTAAEIAGERCANFRFAGTWTLQKQSISRYQHSRRAKPTLYSAVFSESALKPLTSFQLWQSFYGPNVCAVHLNCGHQAGVDRKPVYKNGTGSTFANPTALLSSRQMQRIPQNIQCPQIGVNTHGHHSAVDLTMDLNVIQRIPPPFLQAGAAQSVL